MTDAVARLPYSLRLADQFWLAAHDDTDPLAPRVAPRALELGCAGGLLLELLADRVITLDSAVRPALETTPAAGGDYLCGHLLNEVHAEPDLDLPTWVEYLATFAAGKVRCRLQTFDVLEERTATAGRVRPVTYPAWRAVDRQERATAERTLTTLFRAPGATLASGSGMLTWSQQIDEVSLAALAHVTGLLPRLDLGRVPARESGERVADWRQRLPARVRAVLGVVEKSLNDSALSPR